MRTARERVQYQPTGRPLALDPQAYGLFFEEQDRQAPAPFEIAGAAAVVDIVGPVVQHKDWLFDSYDAIVERVQAASASAASAVVLRIDSPGGDALGVMECARELRATCAKAGKPLLAFVDGMACSAAYALATPASVVVTPPAGVVGSVGIFQPVIDATAADAQMGLKIKLKSSGKRKLDGNPHAVTSESAEENIQRRVDGLATLFFELVAEMRPSMTVDAIRALEGNTFLGAEAVSVGLADRVGSWSDVLAMVAGAAEKATAPAAATKETAMAEETKDTSKAGIRKALTAAIAAAIAAAFPDDVEPEKKDGETPPEKKAEVTPEKKDGETPPEKKTDACTPKTETEPEKKDESKALAEVRAIALASARELQTLKAQNAAKEESQARAALFAQRPDFDANVKATLSLVPLADLKKAVETWPRSTNPLAAAASVTGTQGARDEDRKASPEVEQYINERMGLAPSGNAKASTHECLTTVFNPEMSQEAAAARLAELTKKAVQ